MKKTGYDQFFTKAQAVRKGDEPVDRVQFKMKPRPANQPARSAAATEKLLRQNVKMPKSKAPFPWRATAGLVVTLVLATGYVLYPESYEKFFAKIEVRAFGQAEAAEKETAKPAEKSTAANPKAEKAAAAGSEKAPAKGPEAKGEVTEDASHFEKLRQRKEELDAREKELSELEEELQRQKVELDKRITQLEEMRGQIGQTLKDRVEVDQEKVNKLVDLYSNMKPKQAADVIGSLNEELAVEVLAKMKKKNAAEVMNLLTPEKARTLSEKYTGYRRISSQEPKG